MAAIRSPGQILKLWKKGTADYFKANSLKDFPDKEKPLNVKLVKGLDHLRKLANQGSKVDVGEFNEARDGTLDAMGKLRKLLLPTKAQPSVKKFFQTLCKLTIVVEQLEADKLDANEADLPADALDAVEEQTSEVESDETKEKPDDNGAARFATRLKTLMPLVLKIAQGKLKGNEILTSLVTKANAQAKSADFTAAHSTLDKAEQLLKAFAKNTTRPPTEPTPNGTPSPEPGTPTSNVAYTKARLLWDKARKSVQAELQKLEQSILQMTKSEPDANQIAANTKNLYEMLDTLDTSLIDKLDEALNAEDSSQRDVLYKQAAAIVGDYSEYVESDPLLGEIDENPFAPVKVRSTLTATLKVLSSQLK